MQRLQQPLRRRRRRSGRPRPRPSRSARRAVVDLALDAAVAADRLFEPGALAHDLLRLVRSSQRFGSSAWRSARRDAGPRRPSQRCLLSSASDFVMSSATAWISARIEPVLLCSPEVSRRQSSPIWSRREVPPSSKHTGSERFAPPDRQRRSVRFTVWFTGSAAIRSPPVPGRAGRCGDRRRTA